MTFGDNAIFDYFNRVEDFAKECRKGGVFNDLPVITGKSQGPEVMVKGCNAPVINCNSLDYLNLGNSVATTQSSGLVEKWGTGFGISRAVADHEIYIQFEKEMAEFKNSVYPRGMKLFNTGYLACYNAILLLAGRVSAAGFPMDKNPPASCFFMDVHAHASLQDAIRGNGFHCKTTSHLNYDELERKLSKAEPETLKFIVEDALFSMNGSFVDCKKLLELAKKYGAIVILDGAHSDGVYGRNGRGLLDHQGIVEQEDLEYFVEIGTLSKAFACIGGYAALPVGFCDLAKVGNFHYIFSVALPPDIVERALLTKRIIAGGIGDERRKILHKKTSEFRNEVRKLEFNAMNSESQIVPIVVGDDKKCQEARDYLLFECGILVGAIRKPAVSSKNALLRFSLTAGHEDYHYEKIIESLKKARDKFRF
ncbi:MAG: hypothetical protein ACD_11C00105G0022 [uncultured bacterium]|nr:MAG: hypothetical protein ACD_11C00105G0022 [uncultured bacterium]HBR71374.1 hypothetical protein [Candidatus Moranbacteria bacterium]